MVKTSSHIYFYDYQKNLSLQPSSSYESGSLGVQNSLVGNYHQLHVSRNVHGTETSILIELIYHRSKPTRKATPEAVYESYGTHWAASQKNVSLTQNALARLGYCFVLQGLAKERGWSQLSTYTPKTNNYYPAGDTVRRGSNLMFNFPARVKWHLPVSQGAQNDFFQGEFEIFELHLSVVKPRLRSEGPTYSFVWCYSGGIRTQFPLALKAVSRISVTNNWSISFTSFFLFF